MANTGENDNGSQFFITLDRADELTRQHTLFGRVIIIKVDALRKRRRERERDLVQKMLY